MKINDDSNNLSSSPFKEGMKSLLHKKVALSVIIILSAVYLIGIFSPLLAPYSYSETNLLNTQSSPSWDHIFGTSIKVNDMNMITYGIDTHMKKEETEDIKTMLQIPFREYRPPVGAKFNKE